MGYKLKGFDLLTDVYLFLINTHIFFFPKKSNFFYLLSSFLIKNGMTKNQWHLRAFYLDLYHEAIVFDQIFEFKTKFSIE